VIGGFEKEFDNYLYHVLLEAAVEKHAQAAEAAEVEEPPPVMRKRAKRLRA
jgi:hypothetical protein